MNNTYFNRFRLRLHGKTCQLDFEFNDKMCHSYHFQKHIFRKTQEEQEPQHTVNDKIVPVRVSLG